MCVSWNGKQCLQREFSFSLHKKSIFHFPSAEKGVICEAGTNNVLPKWGTPFLINSRPHFMGISPIGCISKLSIHFSTKWQVSVDLVGTRWNLNSRCLIVFSWFFQKIIFRYKTWHLVRDPLRVLQDSTHSKERSSPPFWPHFECGLRNSKKSNKCKTFAFCHFMWPSFHKK